MKGTSHNGGRRPTRPYGVAELMRVRDGHRSTETDAKLFRNPLLILVILYVRNRRVAFVLRSNGYIMSNSKHSVCSGTTPELSGREISIQKLP